MQGVGAHVKWLLDAVLETLVHNALPRVNPVGIGVLLDTSLDELIGYLAIQLMSQVIGGWVGEICIRASVLQIFRHLQRAILEQNTLRLERVEQLFAEADARFVGMVTAVDDNGLPAIPVLENNYIVLKVEVDAELVGRQVDAQESASLKRDLLAFDVLE